MAAYRMTVHRVTGLTPNMAMLGREVMLPATLIAKPPEEPSPTSVPFVKDLRDALRHAHQQVREAMQSVARTQKRHYDERSRHTKFTQDKDNWSGYFGPDLPSDKNSKSCNNCGLVPGV